MILLINNKYVLGVVSQILYSGRSQSGWRFSLILNDAKFYVHHFSLDPDKYLCRCKSVPGTGGSSKGDEEKDWQSLLEPR